MIRRNIYMNIQFIQKVSNTHFYIQQINHAIKWQAISGFSLAYLHLTLAVSIANILESVKVGETLAFSLHLMSYRLSIGLFTCHLGSL